MRVPKGTDTQIVVCVYFKSNVNGLKVYYYTSDIRVSVLVKTSHVRKTKLHVSLDRLLWEINIMYLAVACPHDNHQHKQLHKLNKMLN